MVKAGVKHAIEWDMILLENDCRILSQYYKIPPFVDFVATSAEWILTK